GLSHVPRFEGSPTNPRIVSKADLRSSPPSLSRTKRGLGKIENVTAAVLLHDSSRASPRSSNRVSLRLRRFAFGRNLERLARRRLRSQQGCFELSQPVRHRSASTAAVLVPTLCVGTQQRPLRGQ